MSQNIIELGYDTAKMSRETQIVLGELNAVYEKAKQLDGIKINIGNADGFGALQKATVAQKDATEQLVTSTKRYREESEKSRQAEEQRHKTIISNSAEEVKAYQDSINGQKNIKSVVNDTERAYQKAANAAVAAGNAQQTAEGKAIVALKTKNSLIETATARMLAYKEASLLASDTTQLSKYNAKLEESERDLARLNNIGRTGFDNMGNAIGRTGNALSRSFGLLRQIAYIIPGIGIAGIFNLAFEAIGGLISRMDIFTRKLVEIEGIQTSIIKTRISGVQSAQEELVVADQLYKASQNKKLSLDQQFKAYEILQDKYPDYLANLKKEQFATAQTADNYKLLKEAIVAKAIAQANEVEIAKRAIQNQNLQFDNEVRDQALKRLNADNVAKGSSAGTFNAKTNLLDVQATSRATADIAQNNKEIAINQNKQVENTKKIAVNNAIIKSLSADIGAQVEKNGSGILGDDKPDKAEKKIKTVKTTADIFKQLVLDISKVDSDVSTTFGERDKARIDAYNKALGDLIQIGVNPASDKIKYLQSVILELNDTVKDAKTGSAGVQSTTGELIKTNQVISNVDKALDDRLNFLKSVRHAKFLDEKKKREVEAIEFVAKAEIAASETISAFASRDFQKRLNEISELESKQQETFDADSKRIRESSLSDQEKANQLSILENKRATEKEANARREKQIQIEQAKFDQKMAAFQVFIQTLLTVAKLGFVTPAAILAGIAGAAAEVAILTKEIPKYAEGTDNHPGGAGIVGEGKKKERVDLPNGRSFIADRAMLLDMPSGTKVTPLEDGVLNEAMNRSLMRGMAYTNGLTLAVNNKTGDQAWKIATWQTAQLKKIMKGSKPVNNIKVVVNSGYDDYVHKQVVR